MSAFQTEDDAAAHVHIDREQARALPDRELLDLARSGNDAGLAVLYERHAEVLRRFLLARGEAPGEVDDLVAESFARLVRRLRAGGGPTDAVRQYLLVTARNLVIDGGAPHESDADIDLDAMPADQDDVDAEVAARVGDGEVLVAYRRLPERWQAVLWYIEIEGLRPRQVAPLLGLTPNTCSALLRRARQGLKAAYTEIADGSRRHLGRRLAAVLGAAVLGPGVAAGLFPAHGVQAAALASSSGGLPPHGGGGRRGLSRPIAVAVGVAVVIAAGAAVAIAAWWSGGQPSRPGAGRAAAVAPATGGGASAGAGAAGTGAGAGRGASAAPLAGGTAAGATTGTGTPRPSTGGSGASSAPTGSAAGSAASAASTAARPSARLDAAALSDGTLSLTVKVPRADGRPREVSVWATVPAAVGVTWAAPRDGTQIGSRGREAAEDPAWARVQLFVVVPADRSTATGRFQLSGLPAGVSVSVSPGPAWQHPDNLLAPLAAGTVVTP